MASMILINTVQALLAGPGGGPQLFVAGETIASTGVQSQIAAAGGVLAPATDTTVAAAAAIVAKLRQKGQADEATASRYMLAAYSNSGYVTANQSAGEELVHVTVDVPLATIIAKTSGTAFNVGAALPTNGKLLSAWINVVETVTGGTLSAVTATLQNTGETAGAILASKSVFAATGKFLVAGSNPQPDRGAQQLQLTLTATGDTLANATTGHLEVHWIVSTLA